MQVKELTLHYRNGRKICLAADAIGREWRGYVPMIGSLQYNEAANPSTVVDRSGLTIQAQAQEILASVRHQLVTFPDELIGVICPRRNELSILSDAFSESDLDGVVAYQHSDDGPIRFSDTTRICICTVHGAKGLSFARCILLGPSSSGNSENFSAGWPTLQ